MTLFDKDLLNECSQLSKQLLAKKIRIATVESCTGGLLASLFTEIPGSSAILDRGFITYSNESKNELLGVSKELLKTYGAVSEEVVKSMAEGALEVCKNVELSIAITGIAGPNGGSKAKPVGLVHFAVARRNESKINIIHKKETFFGSRSDIRLQSLKTALEMIRISVESN